LPEPVIALYGPTGVGKTAVALELAELLRSCGEEPVAVGADALQVYRGLEVLTGAPTRAERARLEHRLVGFVPVTEPFSVGDYMSLAHREIDSLLAEGRRPIVVGGTGLYMRAALADLSLRSAEAGEESELWSASTRHPTRLFGLTMERSRLYERIDARVEAIASAGALEEVRAAEALGPSRTARVALGFRELPTGDLDTMKRRSRNLAKRQLAWMRKMSGLTAVDVTGRPPGAIARDLLP
jgi:tRNA dimethylallyltransferase